jgi:hypothetical protein
MTTQTASGGTTLLQVVERVLIAVAIAATIGAGSAILSNWNTNSLQGQQLEALSYKLSTTDRLIKELESTQRQLAVLNERISWLVNKSN